MIVALGDTQLDDELCLILKMVSQFRRFALSSWITAT